MEETQKKMWAMQLEIVKRQEAEDNFCNAYVRLAPVNRRRVDRHLMDRAYYLEMGIRPVEDYMRVCYLQLQRISQEMANAWNLWASNLLKTRPSRFDCSKAIVGLLMALARLRWVEQPSQRGPVTRTGGAK